ncbi:glycosyltransferase [Paenibacillus aurantiacus]|uniref:Glycosyltransferase n=1 Tax=Paenibacillus aurantiacus TaxID=1936118 RepID=A0ABV5KMU5_9BACL
MKTPKRKLRKKSPAAKINPLSEKVIQRIAVRVLKDIRRSSAPSAGAPPSAARTRLPQREVKYIHLHEAANVQQKKVMAVSFLSDPSAWRLEQAIVDNLRLLAREADVYKPYHDLSSLAQQLEPDLVLILADRQPIPADCLDELSRLSVKKAIWLSDSLEAYSDASSLKPIFQVVFTQQMARISGYLRAGCEQVHHLPFSADRAIYYPTPRRESYVCDLLLVGEPDAACAEAIRTLRSERGLTVWGLGEHGDYADRSIEACADAQTPADYYNGAGMVVNFSHVSRQAFEIAACGSFQLLPSQSGVLDYLTPGQEVVTFRSAGDLSEKVAYYLDQVEQVRMISSKALWGSTYRYSFLQIAAKLLHVVFQT